MKGWLNMHNIYELFACQRRVLLSADYICKQLGQRVGPELDPSRFDSLVVFLLEFFEKVNFKNVSRRQKNHEKLTSMQRVMLLNYDSSRLFYYLR